MVAIFSVFKWGKNSETWKVYCHIIFMPHWNFNFQEKLTKCFFRHFSYQIILKKKKLYTPTHEQIKDITFQLGMPVKLFKVFTKWDFEWRATTWFQTIAQWIIQWTNKMCKQHQDWVPFFATISRSSIGICTDKT